MFRGYGVHRDRHALTHSVPPRRSSDLTRSDETGSSRRVTSHSELLKMAESLLRPVVVGVDTSNGEDFTVLDGLDASTNIHIKDLGLELAGCARDGNRFVGGGREIGRAHV